MATGDASAPLKSLKKAMDEMMEEIHKIQFEMALEVKRICQNHNIEYFLIAGTLLGAVRHKGFIPWDDDLDIGMLRIDYNKFISLAPIEMDKKYVLQTWDTDPGFALPSAKLRKSGTKYIERNSQKANIHNGIFIDIFPFDNAPRGRFEKNIQNATTYVLKRMILVRQGYEVWEEQEFLKKIMYKSLNLIAKRVSLNKLKATLGKVMVRYNHQPSDCVVAFGGSYGYRKEMIRRNWIEHLTTIEFEGEELPCPMYFREYLTQLYGDYMTPPPEDSRYGRHKIIMIEFGDNT